MIIPVIFILCRLRFKNLKQNSVILSDTKKGLPVAGEAWNIPVKPDILQGDDLNRCFIRQSIVISYTKCRVVCSLKVISFSRY